MKIVVVGCGKIGKTIISSLVNERHDVVAIDVNQKVIEEVRTAYDVIALCGSGTEYSELKEAGIEKTELFIAVTGSDELNMLACFVAKKMGAKHTVARIRDIENNDANLSFIKDELDLSMSINPERMTAEAIYNLIKLPSATKVEHFSNSPLEMIEVTVKNDSNLDGISLIDLRKNNKEKFLVGTVLRNGRMFVPKGSFTIQNGDKLGIIVSKKDAHKVLSIMGANHIAVKNVIILGAGKISNYLAKLLINSKHNVKLIDNDKQVCREVCEDLPDNATVIHGDGMSQELLIEEGILSTDAFVALTGVDEKNILISFYAVSQNVPKVITKVNSDELAKIADNLGLNSMITPKKIVADVIVKYARALEKSIDSQIETLYSIMNGFAEAIEFKVLPDFEYTNIPLKEMELHDNVLIAGITRSNTAIIPNGDDVILPGDNVIVIAEGKHVLSLSEIIKR